MRVCHGLLCLSVTVCGGGGGGCKFLPLNFNTLFQIVFHKIIPNIGNYGPKIDNNGYHYVSDYKMMK